jgi:signal peptidase II
VGLALILSGALGNLIDRLCVPPYQVRDFLDFLPTLPLVGKWPVFNIADSCICIGVALVFIAELVQAPPEETGARGDASPDQNPPNATT